MPEFKLFIMYLIIALATILFLVYCLIRIGYYFSAEDEPEDGFDYNPNERKYK